MNKAEHFVIKIIHGAMEHIIVLGLVGAGSLLAPTMAPDETALQYEAKTFEVAGTSTAHIQISNQTKRAINVTLRAPGPKPVSFTTSVPSAPNVTSADGLWRGTITPQQQVSVLLVVEGDLPEALVAKMVTAKFATVDEATGTVVERAAEIRERSALPISRSVRYGFWFMAPLLLAGVLFITWIKLRKKFGNPNPDKPKEATGNTEKDSAKVG